MNNKRGIIMGFLNILGYIGVGLAAAGIFIGISFAMSRLNETVLYEDGSTSKERGDGDWVRAYVISVVILWAASILLLYNLAHFSVLKSIGLGLLFNVIAVFIIIPLLTAITKKSKSKDIEFKISTTINSLLNGAAFAILVSVWGWF